jgi:tetratricopeptide (TPR) repeat protein
VQRAELGEVARAGELYELAIELMEEHAQPYLMEACSAYAQLLKERDRLEDALAVLERGVRGTTMRRPSRIYRDRGEP